jgi:riboflavin-specific deaminase-like protein
METDSARYLDAATLYEGLTFPPGSDVRPHLAVNMISTADGKAAIGGQAAPIGSPADRVVMRRLRAAVDCVLVGAGTIRAEAFDIRVGPAEQTAREARGQAAQPLVAILTNTGDLPIDRRALFRGREPRPLVFTCQRAVRAYPERFARLREVATVVPSGVEALDLPSLLAVLARDFGARRVLVEGGPALNQAFFAVDLVDELFLTIAPRVVGGRSKTIVEADFEPTLDLARLALVSVAAADDEVFLRYRVTRDVVQF